MQHISITFDHEGVTHEGSLDQVSGAGHSTVFHLMINSRYHGVLEISAFDGNWVFRSQDRRFEELADFFGKHVTEAGSGK